ncbi:MAG TPA: HAMP domain-containing sensor histidine kinase [Acidimicrobiales bacterium]|nr:HAMP domain-containing sensor histidine kinase [Acidimicrobiales bacterium]
MSLRRRLAIGLAAISAVLVLTNVVLSNTFEAYLLDRVDRQLVDVAREGARLRAPGLGPRSGPGVELDDSDRAVSEFFIALGEPGSSQYVRVSSSFGGENAPTPRLDQASIGSHLTGVEGAAQPFTTTSAAGRGAWRVVAQLDPRAGLVTIVAASLNELHDTVARTRRVQVIGTGAVLAALGLVSWWMVRLGIQPLETMASTADAIAGGDLSHRVEHPGVETEAGRLGAALNSMLGRIEESFRAQEASEARVRRFAADASHELRTPLTSIRGYAELWRAGGLRDEEQLSDAMRRVEQEASRMGALVDDLLLLARLDQGRPLERARVRLDELVHDGARDARAVEPHRSIEVIAEPIEVDGDELRLRQVVANLLANVREHANSDAAVKLQVSRDGDSAVLQVTDTGPGMAPEVAAHVFERFYRADQSRARATGNTGLGLSIVAAIVEAHGGTASVASDVAQGSTFVMRLPAAEHPNEAEPAVPST